MIDAVLVRQAIISATRVLDEKSRTASPIRQLEIRMTSDALLRLVRDDQVIAVIAEAFNQAEP